MIEKIKKGWYVGDNMEWTIRWMVQNKILKRNERAGGNRGSLSDFALKADAPNETVVIVDYNGSLSYFTE